MAYARSAVESWQQKGIFYFWRYTENERNYPGWHFMVDAAASQSISALASAFTAEGPHPARVLIVSPPSEVVLSVPNNKNGQAAWQSPGKLRMALVVDDSAAWSIDVEGALVEWRFGSTWAGGRCRCLQRSWAALRLHNWWRSARVVLGFAA